jgi:hypothetical protein
MARRFVRGDVFVSAANRRKSSPPSAGALVDRAAGKTIELLESRTLLSSSWFVAPTGSDQNPGTLNAPFQTIQHAASLAQPGDQVEIRAGVYHETVTPANSGTAGAPIAFEAYNNEQVIISGADPVSGWSSYSGSIYQASMPWTLGEGKDQVFVDGRMVNEARWPNSGVDLSHPTLSHAQSVSVSGSTATIHDPSLTQPAGYWKGATIHITPGQQWIAQTGTVISSSPGQLTYSFIPLDSYEQPKAGNAYYLTGTFKALDSAGEWFRDNGGNLYLWDPASDSPAKHDIEAKARQYAFNVSGDSYITIQNVNLFAATIKSDGGSDHLVINHISAKYVGQFLSLPHGWDVPTNTGIILAGNNSVLENSTIAFSAGDGVYATGANVHITNNVIHDVDYVAADAAGIRVYGDGSTIDHNTIYNTGRSGILHQAAGLKILYNLIHDVGLQTTEAGGIYTVNTNGGGTEIAYNQIYNMHSGGFGQTGLFLDNNSDNYVVHHNQVWNVDHALKLNFTCRNDNIYNNTLNGTQTSVLTNRQGDWNGTTITNNVFFKRAVLNSGATVKNNATAATAGLGAGDFVSGADGSSVSSPPSTVPSTPPSNGGSSGGAKSPSGSGSSSGSTSGGGNSSGTGSSGSSSSSDNQPTGSDTNTQPPAPVPPVTPTPAPAPIDYPTLLASDRAAIKAASLARRQHLKDLAAIIRADSAAYRAARRQLRIAQHTAHKARIDPASDPTVAALNTDLQNLNAAVQADRANLAQARHADFSGIKSAKLNLRTDQRAYRVLRHRAK